MLPRCHFNVLSGTADSAHDMNAAVEYVKAGLYAMTGAVGRASGLRFRMACHSRTRNETLACSLTKMSVRTWYPN